MDLRKFDKRIVGRNIDKGLVTHKDYQKYLTDLKNLDGEYELFEVQPPDQKVSQGEDTEAENDSGENAGKEKA